jgi:hypothetical protein
VLFWGVRQQFLLLEDHFWSIKSIFRRAKQLLGYLKVILGQQMFLGYEIFI